MSQDHVAVNKDYWNASAPDWVAGGEHGWAAPEPTWGIWSLPDKDVPMLPDDMTGMAAVELGCGTGYVSRWMERRGATVTGVDLSAEQLATARRLAAQHGSGIAFVEGNCETLPFADASFDFAVSEYGAAIWCDPDIWLREAWRVLRPGGRLSFLGNHPLTITCSGPNGEHPDTTLHRDYRDLWGADWSAVEIDPAGVEFNRTFAGWWQLFRDVGFVVEDFQELYAPMDTAHARFHIPADWAKRFPSEQVWWLRKAEGQRIPANT